VFDGDGVVWWDLAQVYIDGEKIFSQSTGKDFFLSTSDSQQ
jgi:hypothetical protein